MSEAGVTMSGAGVTMSGAGVTMSGAGVTMSGAGVTMSGAGVTMSGADVTMSGADVTMSGAVVTVPVSRLPHGADLPLPAYATPGAAGLDLLAAIPAGKPLTLAPFAHALVPTGLTLALPHGFEAQVRPRSGLALRHGVTVLNSPGTIDSDYRGEVGVILINLSDKPFIIERGHRIAQMVIAAVAGIAWSETAELPASGRGKGGFGSTGGHT